MFHVDDFLILNKDNKSLYKHLQVMLSRLQDDAFHCTLESCEFKKDVIYLPGLLFGNDGIQTNPQSISITNSCPKPDFLTCLQSSFGQLLSFC